jgi:tRNA(Ile)-lysidine synthase
MIKLYAFIAFFQEKKSQIMQMKNDQWREDSSNASDKYLRKIRHDLVPLLKELNPILPRFKTQSYLGITSHG